MFCSKCGKSLEPGARFCSACGTAYDPAAQPEFAQTSYQAGAGQGAAGQGAAGYGSAGYGAAGAPPYANASAPLFGQLTRPRHPRVIAGVCSGLALHYGWDVSLVRVLWLLCILFAGTGFLAYIIAWIVIPEATYALQPPPPPPGYGA